MAHLPQWNCADGGCLGTVVIRGKLSNCTELYRQKMFSRVASKSGMGHLLFPFPTACLLKLHVYTKQRIQSDHFSVVFKGPGREILYHNTILNGPV